MSFLRLDELAHWASRRSSGFFLRPDAKLLVALGTVSTRASSQSYDPAAVNTFLLVADYYLVGYALAHGHIVTHEIASTSTKKIKIPDACIGLGIKVVSPYEMLRTERARFILEP
jgi:hypothetical protein